MHLFQVEIESVRHSAFLKRIFGSWPNVYNASPMMKPEAQRVTQLLLSWTEGNPVALEELMPLVNQELRRIASYRLRRERPNHTLDSAALVNEAYLRLIDQKKVCWQNRSHFFAIAAQMMRRILVDHARAKAVGKRGGDAMF